MRWIVSLKKPMNGREFATRVWENYKLKNNNKKKVKKKTFNTRDSRVVPHRSTDQAQWCLTSQFGRDAVYPPWYDRMMGPMFF